LARRHESDGYDSQIQYVVHMQVFDGDQKPWFHQGDYFTKTNGSAPVGSAIRELRY
jgi:hypothetical protein